MRVLWARAARRVLRALLRALFRMHLGGTPPVSGPYILVANHQGWADAFAILALFPPEPRIYFIADRAATMRSQWWKRLALRTLGVVVPVDRDGGSERAAIEHALDLLEGGAVVAIFAEGRVSRTEAQLGPFRRGVGYLALKAKVPVVPVWIAGTAELYLGRAITLTLGDARHAPDLEPTRANTTAYAATLHDDLARIARPWVEPHAGPRRWRWLTDIL